jgi:copper transport protein
VRHAGRATEAAVGAAVRSTILAVFALVILAGVAFAHALPQSSDPSPGASLAQAPAQVSIVFGERPDPKLSSINVLDTTGTAVTSGPTVVAHGNEAELVVPLKPLPTGVYTVAWRTVSAVDGHVAAGSFAFGVGGAEPSASATGAEPSASTSSAGPTPAAIAGRWLMYLSLVALLGAALFAAVVTPGVGTISRRLVPGAWLVALAGTVAVVAAQLSDAGVGLSDAFGTSFGPVIVERFVPLGVAGLAIAVLLARPATTRSALVVAALGAAGAMLADVLASHAAAGALPILGVAVQWLHILAVGAWLGGLGGLLFAVRGEAGDATARTARRFAYLATAGIATVGATGLLRAIAEVGTLDNLVSTDFGRLVIAKTALLGLLAMLGALNHFVNVPAAGRRLGGLRRAGSVELVVGATVLVLSASLVNLAPPVEAGGGNGSAQPASPAPTAAPLVVAGNDFGTSVRLSLTVSPGTAGFNTFTARATDFDSGAPVPATSITLRFSIPARSDIGESRLELVSAGDGSGVFKASGPNLSIGGTWSVTALVVNGLASVEVPLTVTTRCAPVPAGPASSVSINAAPGLPTLYTAALTSGRTVQAYLDPGTAGANELHVTFFDQAGTELPVQQVTEQIGPSGCALAPLTPRQLEPGHFVADTTLPAGTYTVSIAGPAPNGDPLAARFDVSVK